MVVGIDPDGLFRYRPQFAFVRNFMTAFRERQSLTVGIPSAGKRSVFARYVTVKRPAEVDVYQLDAAADPEDRPVKTYRRFQKSVFASVAPFSYRFRCKLRIFTI